MSRQVVRIAAAAIAAACLSVPAAAQLFQRDDDPWLRLDTAVLQGLDKITARISTFSVPVGQPVRFGTLIITVETCQKRPPTETPESAAFLDVDEQPPDESRRGLFAGWMFASSPALNALEHPVYDVWVVDCSSSETAPQSSTSQ